MSRGQGWVDAVRLLNEATDFNSTLIVALEAVEVTPYAPTAEQRGRAGLLANEISFTCDRCSHQWPHRALNWSPMKALSEEAREKLDPSFVPCMGALQQGPALQLEPGWWRCPNGCNAEGATP